MSQIRQELTIDQEPFLAVRSFTCGYSNGTLIEPHRHNWHQLLYACAGAMSVHAERHSWMIPPGKAVFIPAMCEHSIRMWGAVAMRSLAFPATLAGHEQITGECRVLSVTLLLRELILRVTTMSALDSRVPSHQRLLGVLLDEMNAAPIAPFALPLPLDSCAQAVARHVLANSAGGDTLDQMARRYGAGKRTLERRFRSETGMSFGLWRQKVRMLDSARLLAQGKSVTDAALDTGYASVSAFIAAFKQTFGYTPGRL
jgi:AraC-like DNA-binding protein